MATLSETLMRAEIIPFSEVGPRELDAWEQLGTAAVLPNPFLEPAFVLPAARAWGLSDLGVLVVRDRANWLAALPVLRVRSWRGVPGRCLVAWRHDYCYLSTPLVTSADPEAALALLIRRGLMVASCLVLDWIDVEGPLAESLGNALAASSRPVVVEQFERAALQRRPAGDYLEHTLSSRHIREYRRKRKQLEREVGKLTLRDDTHDPAAYERFLDLERAGWKGAVGTAMASRPGHGTFFTEMCTAFARSGKLQLLSLTADQRTVAMRSELIGGDTSFTFKIAFDEEFARFSSGIQLEIANIERFHASGLARSDSCADADNATLNRLWFDRRRLRSVVATAQRASGAPAYAKWRAASAALPLRRKLKGFRGS